MSATATVWLPFLVFVLALVFWGYCLLDLTRTDEREVRTFTKPVWTVLLVFGSVVGGLLWLAAGRPPDPGSR
ncbi:PLDc N-terminal domain-containing protein [Cellulomonas sp. WB94]|uniref:PLDc N-terminal domain-containing protein n=1 Tax=Cellulomonas sp. WB94 TaxID=2173174 RepID=UPI001304D620|nr:PLDc N-terminal domain-containing protein [Cellulomonas sp. WB94]